VRHGCFRLPASARRARIEDYLLNVVATALVIVDCDSAAAERHAREHVRLSQLGKSPPFADGQIAAIAATNGLTLVTFNVQDYAQFSGLEVTDWRG
jgi:tRNA(fMet)-specific endonuclease VapC